MSCQTPKTCAPVFGAECSNIFTRGVCFVGITGLEVAQISWKENRRLD